MEKQLIGIKQQDGVGCRRYTLCVFSRRYHGGFFAFDSTSIPAIRLCPLRMGVFVDYHENEGVSSRRCQNE